MFTPTYTQSFTCPTFDIYCKYTVVNHGSVVWQLLDNWHHGRIQGFVLCLCVCEGLCKFHSFGQGHVTYGNVLSVQRKVWTCSLDSVRLFVHRSCSSFHPDTLCVWCPADYLTCGWMKRSDVSWRPKWCTYPSYRRTQPCCWTQTSIGECVVVFVVQTHAQDTQPHTDVNSFSLSRTHVSPV